MITSLKSIPRKLVNRSYKRQINQAVAALPYNQQIKLLDIGSAGGIQPRWKDYAKFIKFIGFDLDIAIKNTDVASKLPLKSSTNFNSLLFEETTSVKFYRTSEAEKSSIYEPNIEILNLFPNVERFRVITTKYESAKKIDDFFGDKIDFIKIDSQGSELNILKGAEVLLQNVLGLEVEVEFIKIYKNQPLVTDVTIFLESAGFVLIDFVNIYRWERESLSGLGQLIFADALFLRKPEDIVTETTIDLKISTYLLILLIYKRFDLIHRTHTLLSPEKREFYSVFMGKISILERRHKRVFYFSSILDFLMKFYDTSYRSHLLY